MVRMMRMMILGGSRKGDKIAGRGVAEGMMRAYTSIEVGKMRVPVKELRRSAQTCENSNGRDRGGENQNNRSKGKRG